MASTISERIKLHGKDTCDARTQNAETTVNLLTLPGEIRNNIYDLVFADQQYDAVLYGLPALQRTGNFQLYAETHRIFYEDSVFVFDSPEECWSWLSTLSAQQRSWLSEVRINLQKKVGMWLCTASYAQLNHQDRVWKVLGIWADQSSVVKALVERRALKLSVVVDMEGDANVTMWYPLPGNPGKSYVCWFDKLAVESRAGYYSYLGPCVITPKDGDA